MGICSSSKKKNQDQSPLSSPANFFPPPDLHRKSTVSCQQQPIILVKTKKDLYLLISGLDLNKKLEEGANLDEYLASIIHNNNLNDKVINDSISELFENIHNQKKLLSCYNCKTLIERILIDFDSFLYKVYLAVENKNFCKISNEGRFIINILFTITLIYQIILSYKRNVFVKKDEKIYYWWLPPLINFTDEYTDIDTYVLMKKKITELGKFINLQLANTIIRQVDSENMVFSVIAALPNKTESIRDSTEQHSAGKCTVYQIKKQI